MAIPHYLNLPLFETEHRQRAKELDAWAQSHVPSLLQSEDEDIEGTTRRLVEELAAGGWLDVAVSVKEGVLPDSSMLCLSRDILASYGALADFAFAMQGLGCGPISIAGTAAQRDEFLPAVISGKKIAAFALTEPEAGSDVAAMAMTARREGDEYVLDGNKTFISNAGIADFYTVFARTGDAGSKGISAFVVPADTLGLDVVEKTKLLAPHPIGALRFTGCRIPVTSMIGDEGQGFRIAMGTLDIFRATVGAAALGLARRAFDETLQWICKRKVFGSKLSSYQLTQAKLADMAVAIDASALLVYRAAWTKRSEGGRATREASMAKLFATEQAQQVIDQAVQLFGGLGVVHGVPVERLYRDVRALRIYEGTSEIQRIVIATQCLKAFEA